jgi:AcrR family transcriptional regulator
MEDGAIDKRDLILDTALRLFNHYGFDKTSISDIADAAGIGKGTFYYYFESKEELFLSIIHEHAERDLAYIQEKANECQTIEEKIRLFIMAPVEWMEQNFMIYVKFLVQNQSIFLRKLNSFKHRLNDRKTEYLRSILLEGQASGELRQSLDMDRIVNIIFDQLTRFGQVLVMNIDEPDLMNEMKADLSAMLDMMLYGVVERKGDA